MTSVGAVLEPLPMLGALFRAREDLLRESGLQVTILRPNALMTNALGWRGSIGATGTVADPFGEGRMPCIDSDDIAAVTAVTLTEPGHEGRGYILTGPQALTSREQVETPADVLGRPLTYVDVTPREYAEAAVAHGAPAAMAPALENLCTMFRTGRAGFVTDDVRNLTGRAPATFRAWCERHADALRG